MRQVFRLRLQRERFTFSGVFSPNGQLSAAPSIRQQDCSGFKPDSLLSRKLSTGAHLHFCIKLSRLFRTIRIIHEAPRCCQVKFSVSTKNHGSRLITATAASKSAAASMIYASASKTFPRRMGKQVSVRSYICNTFLKLCV